MIRMEFTEEERRLLLSILKIVTIQGAVAEVFVMVKKKIESGVES